MDEEEQKTRGRKLFGLDIEKYLSPEEIEKKPLEGSLEPSIMLAIATIEKEIESLSAKMQGTLQIMEQKLSSLQVSIGSASKLDIEGAELCSTVSLLQKLYKTKESSMHSLLRLKLALSVSSIDGCLSYIEKQAQAIFEWIPKAREYSICREKSLVEKSTMLSIRAALRILEKPDLFSMDLQAIKASLHASEQFVEKNMQTCYEKQKEEENAFLDESFVYLSHQEERALQHILSLYS